MISIGSAGVTVRFYDKFICYHSEGDELVSVGVLEEYSKFGIASF